MKKCNFVQFFQCVEKLGSELCKFDKKTGHFCHRRKLNKRTRGKKYLPKTTTLNARLVLCVKINKNKLKNRQIELNMVNIIYICLRKRKRGEKVTILQKIGIFLILSKTPARQYASQNFSWLLSNYMVIYLRGFSDIPELRPQKGVSLAAQFTGALPLK